MGLMKELSDLNAIYRKMTEVDEAVYGGKKEAPKDNRMVVTNADKKGNTPAYQNYKKGMKGKDGKPMYKAADHMKEEKGKEKNCGCGQDPCITYGKQDSNSMKEGYGKGVKMADLPKGSKVGSKKVDMPKGSKKKVGHDCASKVKHESYGIGDCIKEMHTLDRFGNITHYDVMFGEQLIKNVPVAHLDIVSEMHHEHYINDDKNAEVLGEKKAAKDYDGDGKIESGKDEYFGSKDKAIKKAMGKKVKEDADSYVEAYVTELNKATMGSYVKKASKDLSDRRFDQGDSEKRKYEPDAADDKEEKKLVQREKGISRAATKLSKEEVSDETKKLIESGKFTQEEIDAIAEADRLGKLEESEKVAQGAYKRAQELGAKRRSKQGVNRGIGKNERAGYNLSQAARSRNASLETQGGNQTGGGSKSFGYAKNKSNPVKSKSTGDTGATGHYKKRDEKVTSKSGKTTRYKLKFADRMNAPVSRRQELKDPKKNPKHTANK